MTTIYSHAVRDVAALHRALKDADIGPLLMVLVQLTGDETILDQVAPYIHGAWSFMEDVPDSLKQRVRDRLVAELLSRAANDAAAPVPSTAMLRRMMAACVGQTVPEEYVPLVQEEIRLDGVDARAVAWHGDPTRLDRSQYPVLVIGAGLSGLCAAVRLQEMGLPFVVLEKNDEVGGTWYENTYPGVGVDTPNHFFSYSFFPSNRWTHHFSKGPEIQAYIEETALHFDLRRHIRFNVEVEAARWDEAAAEWAVTLRRKDGSRETLRARVVITAVGQLNRPSIPDIPGLDRFRGPTFHTAQWDHGADLAGRRVALIGTGASAVQAGPSIAPEVGRLLVFQRTPHWVIANENYHKEVSDGSRWAMENIPFYSEWLRFQLFWASSDGFHASLQMDPTWDRPAQSLNKDNQVMRDRLEAHLRAQLATKPELIERCTPDYPPYGKRMLRDNHWFAMLCRDNVDLVDGSIREITETGLVMQDGTVHELDAIVFATGFQAAKVLWPMAITGRGGVSIRDVWGDDDPRAYLGLTAPEFPNLFVTFGPNTNLAHGGSAIFHFECQVRYITQALREMVERGALATEVRREVHDSYNRLVDAKCANMVWSHPGVTNWYKNKSGRVTVTSPWRLVDYWALTRTFVPEEYLWTGDATSQAARLAHAV